MKECELQIGFFFIRFMTFTSTLVYSVVWNQSTETGLMGDGFDTAG